MVVSALFSQQSVPGGEVGRILQRLVPGGEVRTRSQRSVPGGEVGRILQGPCQAVMLESGSKGQCQVVRSGHKRIRGCEGVSFAPSFFHKKVRVEGQALGVDRSRTAGRWCSPAPPWRGRDAPEARSGLDPVKARERLLPAVVLLVPALAGTKSRPVARFRRSAEGTDFFSSKKSAGRTRADPLGVTFGSAPEQALEPGATLQGFL